VRRIALVVLVTLVTACSVNDYCLNCIKPDDGGGSNDGGDGDGGTGDGGNGDGGACIPSGPEICDGKDNDCNGLVDDNPTDTGGLCDNQMGVCAGGVKVCVMGVLKCSKTPSPEICDNLDNDCNGLTDEGDPGGGSHCGTDVGDCTAGTNHCVAGHIQCQGFDDHTMDPEICDGKDNDCDGNFDEGLTNMGPCGVKTCVGGTKRGSVCQTSTDCTGGGTCLANVGLCHQGTLSCQGGAPQCQMFTTPSFELCDHMDNDCDGNVDEDFHTQTDTSNCGDCNIVCPVPPHAVATCTPNAMNVGTCGYTCLAGWNDLDGNPSNGCEYACFKSGVEVCDGLDNDCDGLFDQDDPDLGAPPAICSTIGECAVGSTVTCAHAAGWVCTYGPTVSQVGGVIVPETECDGKDNDCNGIIDDHQPNLTEDCDDGGKGECKSTGTFTCDTGNPTGPAICTYTHMGATPVTETCNNKDDDCDGVIDNETAVGTLAGLEWVNVGGGHQMMKYEASKPDSTATDSGEVITSSCGGTSTITTITEVTTTATFTTSAAHDLAVGRVILVAGTTVAGYNTTFVVSSVPTPTTFTITAPSGLGSASGGTAAPQCPTCSTAGREPWTNVTYPQAVAACKAVGANLCSETQWHRACAVVDSVTWPIGGATGIPVTGTLIEAEDPIGIASATSTSLHSWAETYINGWSSIGAMQAEPNNDAAPVIANAVAQSPRLDYQVRFATTAATYHVWVRMWAANANDNSIFLAVSPAAPPQTPTTTMTLTVAQSNGNWVWKDSGALTIAAGVQNLSVYMAKDGVAIDALYIVSGAGVPPATVTPLGNTWAYAATANTYQPTTCNGHDYDATTDATFATGTAASCFANDAGFVGGTTNDHVFDMSGNVKEWTLAHQTGQNPIRGGASNNTDIGISCALNFTLADDSFFFPNVGFRCCR
jgi:hypothetical protein